MTRKTPIEQARKIATALNGRVVRLSETRAVRFRVIEEGIDLAALRQEREALAQVLTQPDEQQSEIVARGLAEVAQRKADVRARLEQIDRELEG